MADPLSLLRVTGWFSTSCPRMPGVSRGTQASPGGPGLSPGGRFGQGAQRCSRPRGLTRACLAVAVQATWMAYDMVVMRTNPALAESMRRLEDAFLNCKEEMEKKWQELLSEAKRAQ